MRIHEPAHFLVEGFRLQRVQHIDARDIVVQDALDLHEQPMKKPEVATRDTDDGGNGVRIGEIGFVGGEAELMVETLYTDDTGDRLIWRWKPVTEMGEESDQ